MRKSVEGVYRNGKIELTELPGEVRDDTRVIVIFLETSPIDLRTRGIDEAQATVLRAQLGSFAEEWDSTDMELYDNYDAAKAKLNVATSSSCSIPTPTCAPPKRALH